MSALCGVFFLVKQSAYFSVTCYLYISLSLCFVADRHKQQQPGTTVSSHIQDGLSARYRSGITAFTMCSSCLDCVRCLSDHICPAEFRGNIYLCILLFVFQMHVLSCV